MQVFDFCLTFASEVSVITTKLYVSRINRINLQIDLIWHSKLSLIKVLYFLARYPALADTSLFVYSECQSHTHIVLQLSDLFCASFYNTCHSNSCELLSFAITFVIREV